MGDIYELGESVATLTSDKPVNQKSLGWLRSRGLPILSLLLALTVMAAIVLTYGRHPERLVELTHFVYAGAFLISLIGNATIILPGAVLVILVGIGAAQFQAVGLLGPILVGLAGGTGAALGEITGYAAGYGGRLAAERLGAYHRVVRWMGRWGSLTILVSSIIPFFFDLVGIAAGTLRYPFWRFLLLCWLGRTLLYTVLITIAALGWANLLPYFG
ncbi:MAG: VTT domain-containing protein [Dehalococcoidales bacterium]|jgi:membrane protein DedA with SNARE-associated domain